MFSGPYRQLRRLGIRLTFWHALLFLAAALIVLSLNYLVTKKQLDTQERDLIDSRLNQYTGEYERGGLGAIQILSAIRKGREQQSSFVRVADSRNRTRFLRHANDWAEFMPSRLEMMPPNVSVPRGWMTLESKTGTILLIEYTWLSDGSLLEVGKSTEGMQGVLAGFRTTILVVLLIVLPASVAGGAFLATRALRPLQHLTAAAEKIVATATFDARVPSEGTGDELDALVQVFNKMLSRIELLIRGMSESLDNVAHDLRTPMTRLRQKAQAAIEADADLETTRDALADCVEEAERVMTLLNTLMDISEAESGLIQFQRLPVKVADVVHTVIDSYAEVADEKGVTVHVEIPFTLCVTGDASALRRAFANLLDNAIKYTPSGGRVSITGRRAGQHAVIDFSDTGCGISTEDLPRIWDRLFRGDKSRSERGLGLGLSFVRAIIESHEGTVTVTSQLDAGTTAGILLRATDVDATTGALGNVKPET
jgi:signal transduction histidine kinase